LESAGRPALAIAVGCCALTAAARGPTASPTWIEAGESVLVLQSPRFYFDWMNAKLPLNIDLFRCATQRLHQTYPQVRLIAQSEFVKVAFPDLDPKAAPVSPDSLKLLLDNATLRARIASLNIRYVIYAGTENDIETVWKGFGCAGGYGGAICGGGGEWKKHSEYDVVITDIKRQREAAAAGAREGTSWTAAVLPLFVGWKSPTEARVCAALGEDVLRLLDAKDKGEDARSPSP
jgi:hypothetical protein